jgi:hypothetical protein
MMPEKGVLGKLRKSFWRWPERKLSQLAASGTAKDGWNDFERRRVC